MPSRVCNLHHSSRQCWILNALSKTRDGTHNLMVPSRIFFRCATKETPGPAFFFFFFFFFFLFFFSFCYFFWPFPQILVVFRLGVESELYPLAYARATATRDPSHICDPHHGSWQCRILNPLSKARDQTLVLMDASWVH